MKPEIDTSVDGHIIEYDQLITKEMAEDIVSVVFIKVISTHSFTPL